MATYSVYRYRERSEREIEEEAVDHPDEYVKSGLSVWAFIVPDFWSFSCYLWLQGAIALAAHVLWFFYPLIASAILLPLGIFYSWIGNKWRTEKLIIRGYKKIGEIEASSKSKAVKSFETKT